MQGKGCKEQGSDDGAIHGFICFVVAKIYDKDESLEICDKTYEEIETSEVYEEVTNVTMIATVAMTHNGEAPKDASVKHKVADNGEVPTCTLLDHMPFNDEASTDVWAAEPGVAMADMVRAESGDESDARKVGRCSYCGGSGPLGGWCNWCKDSGLIYENVQDVHYEAGCGICWACHGRGTLGELCNEQCTIRTRYKADNGVPLECNNCGHRGVGHLGATCRECSEGGFEFARETEGGFVFLNGWSKLPHDWILLDNQLTVNMFSNKVLITNVQEVDKDKQGI